MPPLTTLGIGTQAYLRQNTIMVSILPVSPLKLTHEAFERLETDGATIEWINPKDSGYPSPMPYYRINGFICVIRSPQDDETD